LIVVRPGGALDRVSPVVNRTGACGSDRHCYRGFSCLIPSTTP
jgi:threonine dehydrogenase-like Zn-dependent dehydrogenase